MGRSIGCSPKWVLFLFFFLTMIFVGQGTAFQASVVLPSGKYNLLLTNCQDKLEEWSSHQSVSSSIFQTSTGWNYSSGIFIRGKWRQQNRSMQPLTRGNRFLASNEGKFDFFTSELSSSGHGIQNISGFMIVSSSAKGRRDGVIIQASGLFNSENGEVCLVCCSKPLEAMAASLRNTTIASPDGFINSSTFGFSQEEDQDCSTRGLMTLVERKSDMKVEGSLESIRNFTDSAWFSPLVLSGKVVNNLDQGFLYRQSLLITSGLFMIEVGIIICQIVYSVRSPSGYFVSVLAIFIQIVVMSIIAAELLYIPLHLLTYRKFKYLFTPLALIPGFAVVFLILLNFLFLSLILRKRRVAKRSNIAERPHELRLASVCIIVYGIIGGVLLWLGNLGTYLQVVRCWFLLPQVVANVFWDIRTKPLHPVYIIGLSLCRIVSIGYDCLRPTIYGYDDLTDFPQGWFWKITASVLFFMVYALIQQRYGGRCFLPQRWFGYQLLARSNNESTTQKSRRQSGSKSDDQPMLDL